MTDQTAATEEQGKRAHKAKPRAHRAKKGDKAEMEKLIDVVEDAVDRGVATAQELHQTIADVPFGVMERVGVLATPDGELRRFHDETAAAVYDLVRDINKQVTRFAVHLVGKADPGPHA